MASVRQFLNKREAYMSLTAKDIILIVATKGRPTEVAILLAKITTQSVIPQRVVIVGSSRDDISIASSMTSGIFETVFLVSPVSGITFQRNEGLRWLIKNEILGKESLVIFFDDDFRPADDWIQQCSNLMNNDADVVGLTGLVLADGAQSGAIDEDTSILFLEGKIPPTPHWASGLQREIDSVYGCNMAFKGSVMLQCEFDENLPLYSWQEDRDMTGQAGRFGKVLFVPSCRGVHLGSKGGRTSGLRFGYSQIANMFYMFRKGTTNSYHLRRFVIRALMSNSARSVYTNRNVDYFGRLRGNLMAIFDLLRGRADPRRILDL